ncbi:MAG: acetyltransferase [Ignavibacteria bacterium]|nr:acetyltransferase [Ignavibacteria bacterium]
MQNRKIALIGYGELGMQIEKLLVQQLKQKITFYYFDDNSFKQKKPNSFKFSQYEEEQHAKLEFYVCLGYKQLKKKSEVLDSLKDLKRKIPSFVHRTSFVSKSAIIEEGVIIYPMCNVDKDVIIEKGSLLNNSVVISHNNIVGDCSYISPGVTTSGNVQIGAGSFIGTGVSISNGARIGKNCRIGIGTIVTSDIQSGKSAIGNPMKILKKKLTLV